MAQGNGVQEHGGILHFWVSAGGREFEAFISRATCEAAHWQAPGARDLADVYRQHRPTLDGIVLGKISAGARQPVVVMARDLE
jgi:hypothetical protein